MKSDKDPHSETPIVEESKKVEDIKEPEIKGDQVKHDVIEPVHKEEAPVSHEEVKPEIKVESSPIKVSEEIKEEESKEESISISPVKEESKFSPWE